MLLLIYSFAVIHIYINVVFVSCLLLFVGKVQIIFNYFRLYNLLIFSSLQALVRAGTIIGELIHLLFRYFYCRFTSLLIKYKQNEQFENGKRTKKRNERERQFVKRKKSRC